MKVFDEYRVIDVGEREVGIEIEMEGENLIPSPLSYWRITGDGSLRGGGVEYVLKQPILRKSVGPRLGYLHRKLLENNAQLIPSDRCGVHIHINVQQLEHEQVMKFILTYLLLEDVLVHWCGDSREGNLFCLRLRDAEYPVLGLIQAQRQGTLKWLQVDDYRYASLNLSSLSKYGSLEFRALSTPQDIRNIKQWADILLAIKDRALRYERLSDIMESVSFNGPIDTVIDILGDNAETVLTHDTETFVMDGVRRIQDIAYTKVEANNPQRKQRDSPAISAWSVTTEHSQ